MQILKGTKDRMPDFNEYTYSKGSIYREDSLDKMAAMAKACRETIVSNDYSGAAKELTQIRKDKVENILKRYPPNIVLGTPYQEFVEVDGNRIRWDPLALTALSIESVPFIMFQRKMDYVIVKSTKEGAEKQFIHHCDDDFREILEIELSKFEKIINHTDEKRT